MEFTLTPEQKLFKQEVLRFARNEIVPRVREHDRTSTFDLESFRKLGKLGILGLHLPEEYGGGGGDALTAVLAGEALGEAGVDAGLTLAYGAHSFLCADILNRHGTEEQKRRYLPKLATGEWIGCMALTEPGAGSDAGAMSAVAVKKGDRYVLNGTKAFITNAPLADLAVVYAKTEPELGHTGVSAFLVEKGTKGFSTGACLVKLGVRTSTTSEVILEDCEVPAENLLGREGEGFLMAMQTVELDRSALLAPVVGAAFYVLDKCARYARDREQFGKPIAEFPAIKRKLANLRIFAEAARCLVYRVAWKRDQGRSMNDLEAAVAKLFIADWSLGVFNDAMILHGGYGYCHDYDVERVFRDTRLTAIGGGTTDIQKVVISTFIQSGFRL